MHCWRVHARRLYKFLRAHMLVSRIAKPHNYCGVYLPTYELAGICRNGVHALASNALHSSCPLYSYLLYTW